MNNDRKKKEMQKGSAIINFVEEQIIIIQVYSEKCEFEEQKEFPLMYCEQGIQKG